MRRSLQGTKMAESISRQIQLWPVVQSIRRIFVAGDEGWRGIREVWPSLKPLVFVLGVAGIAAAGFTITSRVLDRKPAPKEATALNCSRNSLVPPDNLRAITLETPPSVLGSSVITNQDFTGW